VLADPSQYDGKEITVRGLYRMVIHGSVLMSSDCGKDLVNMRQTTDYKGDKHARAMVRSVTRKDQFQSVDVVLRGTFRIAGKGECFGQNCLRYEIEDHELFVQRRPSLRVPDLRPTAARLTKNPDCTEKLLNERYGLISSTDRTGQEETTYLC
jgi:hypothetical protein